MTGPEAFLRKKKKGLFVVAALGLRARTALTIVLTIASDLDLEKETSVRSWSCWLYTM